jgi:SsrA-binding protein
MSKTKKKKANQIVVNRKARRDYWIETIYEAGIVLEGWEVKSLRAHHMEIKESYVLIKNAEAWLSGAHISPLPSASSHVETQPVRLRKLLLNSSELAKLTSAIEQDGYTLVPLSAYWKHGFAKLEIGLAKGKKQHDKRETIKKRDWDREKQRMLKKTNR